MSPTDFENAFHDDDGHVTHVAEIIGALGIKGGVVGGMWLSLKCLLLSSNHFLSYKRDPLSYKPFAVNPNSNTLSFHIAKALDDDGVCFCCHFLFAAAGAAARESIASVCNSIVINSSKSINRLDIPL